MSSRGNTTILVISTILVIWLMIRAIHFACIPPFEPEISLPSSPQVQLHGTTMALDTPNGTLRIKAFKAKPGHQRVGFFKLGPSTFFVLEGVTISCHNRGRERWRISGEMAHLNSSTVEFCGKTLVRRRGKADQVDKNLEIDLRRGELQDKK